MILKMIDLRPLVKLWLFHIYGLIKGEYMFFVIYGLVLLITVLLSVITEKLHYKVIDLKLKTVNEKSTNSRSYYLSDFLRGSLYSPEFQAFLFITSLLTFLVVGLILSFFDTLPLPKLVLAILFFIKPIIILSLIHLHIEYKFKIYIDESYSFSYKFNRFINNIAIKIVDKNKDKEKEKVSSDKNSIL